MNLKPVGLLWDSVSNNTGDIAIGMMLKRICGINHIPYDIVNPFFNDPNKYSTYIVGGGQLLRNSNDVFYQYFRVPGHHILNTIGIHHPDHLEYLSDYRLVSVRSQAEKEQINRDYPGLTIKVCPCLTIQLGQYYKPEIDDKNNCQQSETNTIGIHLNNTTLRLLPDIIPSLEILNQKYQLMFIPFTHYENDRYLMEILTKWLPGARVSSANDPISIFSEIGRLKAMISSSMHAATFAYVQNVPVLAFPQDFKIRYFFEERGFPNSFYTKGRDLPGKLYDLLSDLPDYSQSIQQDNLTINSHVNEIIKLINETVDNNYPRKPISTNDRSNAIHKSYYAYILDRIIENNVLSSQILDYQMQIMHLERNAIKEDASHILQINFPHLLHKLTGKIKRVVHKIKNKKDVELILSSGLFDKEWYLNHYPDVENSKIDPTWHYLIYGGLEGREPGPYFKSTWYLDTYEDVKKAGINPLVHYLKYGREEGRTAQPDQAINARVGI
jgi:hypothetical protein